jgi:tRNA(fMet)-specific endonuclease VapC
VKFLLDTNIVTAGINGETSVLTRLQTHRAEEVYLCQPVYYEIMRGLIWKKAATKITAVEQLRVRLGWYSLIDEDWELASRLWADMTGKGRQFSDVDLLIAAIAIRHDAVIVTADDDFDALPVKRENWRKI